MSPSGRGTAPGAFTPAGPGAHGCGALWSCPGLVLVPRGRGPVGVQGQGPAPPMDRNLVVEKTQQDTILGAGLAAVLLVLDVVHVTRRRGLVAPGGPPALTIPQDHRVADRGRDRLGVPDIQRQAGAAEADAELPAAQEAGQPAR